MIIAAVFLGLVIAYFYLRRLADNTGERKPRVVPLPEKHPPVDFTPATPLPVLSNQRVKDDLKQITGIGPKLEQMLNAKGIYSFRQIADWQDTDIQAIDKALPAFQGRIRRDDWVRQARRLLDAGGTARPSPKS